MTRDTEDVVAELRAICDPNGLADKAADLIQSLSDRIDVLRSDCKFLLACIDQSNEAGAPVDESDPEDIATIDQIRAALHQEGIAPK